MKWDGDFQKIKKMSWNNRIMRRKTDHGYYYSIHEVFYDDEGQINGWTHEGICAGGETVEDLIGMLEMQLNDIKKSQYKILDYETGTPITS